MYLVKSISFVLMLSEVYTSRQFAKRRSTYSSSSAKKSFSTCRSEIQIPSSWSMAIPAHKSPHPTAPPTDTRVRIREGDTRSGDKRNSGPGRDAKKQKLAQPDGQFILHSWRTPSWYPGRPQPAMEHTEYEYSILFLFFFFFPLLRKKRRILSLYLPLSLFVPFSVSLSLSLSPTRMCVR